MRHFIVGFIWFLVMQGLAYAFIGRTLTFWEGMIGWPIFMFGAGSILSRLAR